MVMLSQLTKFSTFHVRPMHIFIPLPNLFLAWGIQSTILVFKGLDMLQYIPRNMHTVFALLCFVVVIH